MADLGALAGLAEGLKQGFLTYQDTKRSNLEQERAALADKLRKQQVQSDLMSKGQQLNPETDEIEYTPLGQLKEKSLLSQYQRDVDQSDPLSQSSLQARDYNRGLLKQIKPGLEGSIQEGMSAKDIQELSKEGLLGKTVSGIYGSQARELTNQRVADSNDFRREALDLRRAEQASRAGDKIHNDKGVATLTQNLNQLERGRAILDQPVITVQEFNDYQQELKNALTGAGGSKSLTALEKVEYKTLQGEWANLKQQVTGKPQDAVPPELRERLKALADHTRDTMAQHRAERAASLVKKSAYKNNPDAMAEQQSAAEYYQSESGHGMLNETAGPKAGVIENGYKFLGGDPSNPKSWQKVN